jgi:hypothetical protein
MTKDELVKYYRMRVREAEKALHDFSRAVAEHGLRTFERTAGTPERDTTEENRKSLQAALDEYRTMLGEVVQAWNDAPLTRGK